jgi:large subunit ribosomal protein L15
MPLIRRLPKRGFNNAAFHKHFAIVNLDDLNSFKSGAVVNEQSLRESKLIRGNFEGIKILGGGELKHDLKIEADKFSASAREKIEKAGGTVTLREASTRQTGPRPAREDVDLGSTPEDAEPKPKKSTKPRARAKASPKKKTKK